MQQKQCSWSEKTDETCCTKQLRWVFRVLGLTHMALEGREVNVRNEEDGLGLEVRHHLEDGHVIALLENGHFDIHNWVEKTQQGAV